MLKNASVLVKAVVHKIRAHCYEWKKVGNGSLGESDRVISTFKGKLAVMMLRIGLVS